MITAEKKRQKIRPNRNDSYISTQNEYDKQSIDRNVNSTECLYNI